nr:hypothetical protein [Tanacetum cinerariifolium]
PSPDYIPGPEEPEQAPPLPNYVPGPEYADNEIVDEDQPYAEDASPIAQSPEYVPESNFEAHPEDDDDEDPEEDPVDYLADGGDDGDDEEEISIPAPVPMPAWTDSEVVRLLAISSPPASPLYPWSSPPPQIPFPPLPPILSSHSPILSPLPFASRREDRPEVTLPPRKRLDIALGPRYEVGESSSAAAARPAGGFTVDYGFVATVDREIMRDPEREVGYGITDSWDEIVETLQGAPVSTDTELGGYVREFETRVRQDTDEIYMRLDDEQTERQLLAGWLNMLFRDRRAHAYTRHLMKTEARMSREAWVRATDASDLVHGRDLHRFQSQMSEIKELQAADRKRQTVISELLRIDHRRSTEILELRTTLQGQVIALQGQVTTLQSHVTTLQGQQGLAGDHIQPELPEEAGGSAMIDQGVTATLAARDALRTTNGDDSHNSGTGVRRTERAARECTYTDFLKYQPLPFKGTEGVASLSQWKIENTSRNTQNQQQRSNKRQNTGRVYTAASGEKKQYVGSKPLCTKCNYHHDGPCAPKCRNCNKIGHLARDCRNTTNTNNANDQRGTGSGQKSRCYECGVQGHFRRECPKMKNKNNHGNQGGRNNAPARVYAVGRAGTDPDTNVVMSTFLLNNRYASILFDTGADRSFVSITFNTQINITPSTLDHCYDVELADG